MNPKTANNYIHFINSIHDRWSPHEGQKKIAQALFRDRFREIFLECGRNFGKTDIIDYCLWRNALLNPGSKSYIFYPLLKQAKEVIWRSERILKFGPTEAISSINNSELRLIFKNGSFIKLDGSDNVDSYRGVKIVDGSLFVYDEFKDFRPEFHEAVKPNLIDAFLMMAGTPPENFDENNQFINEADDCLHDEEKYHFHGTAFDNPHIKREFIEKEKARLYRRGEGDIFEREWMAKRVKGGSKSIFPMLSKSMIKPWEKIMLELRRDVHKLRYHCIADPGSTTCFAVLFLAINPFTKHVYVLDEIYEKEQAKTSVKLIGARVMEKKQDYYKKASWQDTYDEAAAWFQTEMLDSFDQFFAPTQKAMNKKEHGLGLIKDIMLEGLLTFSDRCPKIYWEMENYIKDKTGKIPKENDHLIDCFRYGLAAECYDLNDREEPKLPKKIENFLSKIKGFRGDKVPQEAWGDNEDYEFKIQEEW